MYSASGRLSFLIYNAMFALAIVAALNHLSVRFGHLVGLRDGPVHLDRSDVTF